MTRPFLAQELRVVGEIHVGEHFQNYIHAAVARRMQNLFLISGSAVVENLVRPLSLGDFQAFWCTCSAKDLQPMARAIWRAAVPTPPLAPCTRAVSEACAFAE